MRRALLLVALVTILCVLFPARSAAGGGTTCYTDADQDDFGTGPGFSPPDGTCDLADFESNNDLDCDDSNPEVNPNAVEICGDGIDNDCDEVGGPPADDDFDGCTWTQENAAGTNDCDSDTDDDGLYDMEELGANCVLDAGETSPIDNDTDNDLILDGVEVNTGGTDPLDYDSDDDGISDGDEDANHDGAVDLLETDPMDADSDDDGLSDGDEISGSPSLSAAVGTDPLDPDSDDDGLNDGLEKGVDLGVASGTTDWWSLPFAGTNTGKWQADTDTASTTDPLLADTDDDGLEDGEEDVDGDGNKDLSETDPNLWDTDEDGYSDGVEVACGSDPLLDTSIPVCPIFSDGFEDGDLLAWSSSVP